MKKCLFASLSVILLLAVGCEKKEEVKKITKTEGELAPDEVVVRVNGRELTKAEWDAYSNLRVAFYRLMKENHKDPMEMMTGHDSLETNLERVKKSSASACLPYFIQNTLLGEASSEFVKTNGAYSADDRASVEKWLTRKYCAEYGKGATGKSFFDRRMKKAGVQEEFERQWQEEVENELYLSIACSNRFVIDEMVISNVYARQIINNYVAKQTNAWILAQASNVVAKIKAGEDFSTLADQYSMEPEKQTGGYMGFCTAADFPSEEMLWEAVKDLKDGESTGIIDAEDSWQILHVISRDESDAKESRLELACIYFRRAWEIPEIPREEVIKALENDRRTRLIKELMAERLPKVKLEFPHGREIFGDLENVLPMFEMIEGKTNVVNKAGGS